MEEAKNKVNTSALVIFWVTVVVFVLVVLVLFFNIPYIRLIIGWPGMAVLSTLGIALIVLAAKAKFTKIARTFFILTGVSALGIGIATVLHNLVYGLLIKLFGESIWSGGGDEPFFFILATIVCPLIFLTGTIGSITVIARKRVTA